MADVQVGWKYTDRVSTARRELLARPGSFEQLVQLVTEDAEVVLVRAKRGQDPGLTECVQPIFVLQLRNCGDALFNGPFGYRAQYWKAAECGLAANALLVGALAAKLMAAAEKSPVAELAHIDVNASLTAASAKIWIQETGALLASSARDLAVERWVSKADSGAQFAVLGLSAPVASTFEVKGALISPEGHEVVPRRKIRRHHDIFEFGFS
jgi:hypothetical protein